LSAQGHTACLATNQIDVESALDEVEQYGKVRQKYNIRYFLYNGGAGTEKRCRGNNLITKFFVK